MSATDHPRGPALIAYDGSALAARGIAEARRLLGEVDVVVACVWQPVDVGFTPGQADALQADRASSVQAAAERTAAEGASLATEAGLRAQATTREAAPTWRGLVDLADELDASVIVLGSHGRSGLAGALLGSVAGAVATHSTRSVLIAHARS